MWLLSSVIIKSSNWKPPLCTQQTPFCKKKTTKGEGLNFWGDVIYERPPRTDEGQKRWQAKASKCLLDSDAAVILFYVLLQESMYLYISFIISCNKLCEAEWYHRLISLFFVCWELKLVGFCWTVGRIRPLLHHIFIQFFVPFGLHNIRFWFYISKIRGSLMVKAIGYGLIDRGFESGLTIFFSFFFPKRNKKLNKNMMKEGSKFCQPSLAKLVICQFMF